MDNLINMFSNLVDKFIHYSIPLGVVIIFFLALIGYTYFTQTRRESHYKELYDRYVKDLERKNTEINKKDNRISKLEKLLDKKYSN